jgi:hypothetical protein
MSKPFSAADLSDQMDRDMTWRLKELSDIRDAIRRADSTTRQMLLRAFITLMYAHWEGHVRFCATKYFQHIALRRKPYTDLQIQFYLNAFLVRLDAFFRSKVSVEEKCRFLQDLLESRGKRFSQINPTLIDTKANLNTDVLHDICKVCGIPFTEFEKEDAFINVLMLKRRNEIAHGEEVYLKESDIDDLSARAIGIMRAFRNLLENKIYDGLFLEQS